MAENDDPQPGRRFFEIQDALLRPNFEYCLDVLPFDSSETWSAVTLELDVTSFDNIVTLSSTDIQFCLLYTSPSPRDRTRYRMPSSA